MTLGTPVKTVKKESDSEKTLDETPGSKTSTGNKTPGSKTSTGSSKRRLKTERTRVAKNTQEPKIEEKKVEEKKVEEKKADVVKPAPVKPEVRSPMAKKMTFNKGDRSPKEEKKETPKTFARQPTASEQLSKVVFKICYETVPGQDLFIIGEDPKLGSWNTEKLKLPLKWSENHVWTGEVAVKKLPKSSAFKFIVKQLDGSFLWENRENRIFDLNKISNTLKTNHKLRTKGSTILDKGGLQVDYEESTGTVTLTYTWEK